MDIIRNSPIKPFFLHAAIYSGTATLSKYCSGKNTPKRALATAVAFFAVGFFGNLTPLTTKLFYWTGVSVNFIPVCVSGGLVATAKVARYFQAKKGEAFKIAEEKDLKPLNIWSLACLKAYYESHPEDFSKLDLRLQVQINRRFLKAWISPLPILECSSFGGSWSKQELQFLAKHQVHNQIKEMYRTGLFRLYYNHDIAFKIDDSMRKFLSYIPVELLKKDHVEALSKEKQYWTYEAIKSSPTRVPHDREAKYALAQCFFDQDLPTPSFFLSLSNAAMEDAMTIIQRNSLPAHRSWLYAFHKYECPGLWDCLDIEEQCSLNWLFKVAGFPLIYLTPSKDNRPTTKRVAEAFREQFAGPFVHEWYFLSPQDQKKINDVLEEFSLEHLPTIETASKEDLESLLSVLETKIFSFKFIHTPAVLKFFKDQSQTRLPPMLFNELKETVKQIEKANTPFEDLTIQQIRGASETELTTKIQAIIKKNGSFAYFDTTKTVLLYNQCKELSTSLPDKDLKDLEYHAYMVARETQRYPMHPHYSTYHIFQRLQQRFSFVTADHKRVLAFEKRGKELNITLSPEMKEEWIRTKKKFQQYEKQRTCLDKIATFCVLPKFVDWIFSRIL